MRVSTTMMYNQHLKYLQQSNTNLDKASAQYNTGLRFQTAGESPAGMAVSIKYGADISQYNQFAINAGLAADSLSAAETALSSMWTTLGSVQSRLIQAVNGTMDETSLNAIAEDLEQAQAQLFDLMNTKNAEGEYIFSGAQSDRPAFSERSDGYYDCQADGSQRSVQVSPTVTVQVTESGLNIFQNCHLAPTLNIATNPAPTLTVVNSEITNYGSFEDLHEQFFNPATGADNQIKFEVTAGATADDPRTYVVTYPDGSTASGEVTKDGDIVINGMTLNVGTSATDVGEFAVELQPIKEDNILNVLENTINVLRNPDISAEEKGKVLAAAQVSVTNAQVQYDMYRGQVGARGSNVESIITSNNSLSVIKQEAKANATEIDAFEAVSNMMSVQYGLQAAQQTFSMVHGTSLFDFI